VSHSELPFIQVNHITFIYPRATPVFEGFSWQVNQGEAWAVLGPSGCGKTTLLYLLAGLRFPTAGKILIDGERVERPLPRVGLILQDYGLLPWATVRQNAELGINIRRFYGPDGKHAPIQPTPAHTSKKWLERLGLDTIADKYPAQISGGQRQRTAIARTLTLEPDLLLMDEPFSSLDAPTREGLQDLILALQQEQNYTYIIVTHAIEEAAILGRKILLLSKPPNTQTVIIDNPTAGTAGHRDSPAYQAICRELRARLGEQ
jgi:ABC-type nitrate/sulfonate/bicarbonate transport system ATPase subunit